ncbi:MAG TPA: hypothetical protein VK797_23200 [Tepidisphaeraceae bacterium]|jgi:hypothetical protein|nr:hypothetical protein [Tepidisphaeraceae bacterium]
MRFQFKGLSEHTIENGPAQVQQRIYLFTDQHGSDARFIVLVRSVVGDKTQELADVSKWPIASVRVKPESITPEQQARLGGIMRVESDGLVKIPGDEGKWFDLHPISTTDAPLDPAQITPAINTH